MTAENCQVVESALGPDFAIRMADIRRTTRMEPVFTQKTAPIIQLEKIQWGQPKRVGKSKICRKPTDSAFWDP